jgi:hypothetical protein
MTDARQGHTYEWNSIKVMAMENGPYPEVQAVRDSLVWPLQYLGRVDAQALKPLPMTYFGGVAP